MPETFTLSIFEERDGARRAVDRAQREVRVAEHILAGLQRESCPANDPMFVGTKLRLHAANWVLMEARMWLRRVSSSDELRCVGGGR